MPGWASVPGGVIAVVRAGAAAEARTIVHGLARACVPAIELTMTVPGAVEIIAELAGSGLQTVLGAGQCWTGTVLGAGTVLDPAEASACAAAGARFLVSPVTDADVLAEAHRCGVPYVGGALTPTEVLASMRAGADAVELFPVGSMGGAGYLRALREPLPGLRAVVSGGIAAGEVGDYLAAGAHAVCLGGALIDREAARRGDVDAVAAWARAALGRISAALRSGPGRYGAALVAFTGEGHGNRYLASQLSLVAQLPRARPSSGGLRPARCECVPVMAGSMPYECGLPRWASGLRGGWCP